MNEAALYIVSGAAVYGGGHHLYLGASHSQDQHPHVLLGVMYLMLAAFALTSAPTYTTTAITTLLPLGKVTVAIGLLLWGTLAWFISAYTHVKPRAALAGLTATWCLFTIANLGSSYSLLYSRITPIPPSQWGNEPMRWSATYSTWWYLVELTMLATLAYGLYACWRFHRSGQRRPAMVMAAGLAVLGATAVVDMLTRAHLLEFEFLAPFGFLALLASGSFYPRLVESPQQTPPVPRERAIADTRAERAKTPAPASKAGTRPETKAKIAHTPASGLPVRPPPPPEKVRPAPVAKPDTPPPAASGSAEIIPASRPDSGHPRRRSTDQLPITAAGQAEAAVSDETDIRILWRVSESLMHIAVYSEMAMRHMNRGETDLRKLEALCRKVHVEALEARRLASQMPHDRPRRPAPPDNKDNDND
jgi:hypothetical protein